MAAMAAGPNAVPLAAVVTAVKAVSLTCAGAAPPRKADPTSGAEATSTPSGLSPDEGSSPSAPATRAGGRNTVPNNAGHRQRRGGSGARRKRSQRRRITRALEAHLQEQMESVDTDEEGKADGVGEGEAGVTEAVKVVEVVSLVEGVEGEEEEVASAADSFFTPQSSVCSFFSDYEDQSEASEAERPSQPNTPSQPTQTTIPAPPPPVPVPADALATTSPAPTALTDPANSPALAPSSSHENAPTLTGLAGSAPTAPVAPAPGTITPVCGPECASGAAAQPPPTASASAVRTPLERPAAAAAAAVGTAAAADLKAADRAAAAPASRPPCAALASCPPPAAPLPRKDGEVHQHTPRRSSGPDALKALRAALATPPTPPSLTLDSSQAQINDSVPRSPGPSSVVSSSTLDVVEDSISMTSTNQETVSVDTDNLSDYARANSPAAFYLPHTDSTTDNPASWKVVRVCRAIVQDLVTTLDIRSAESGLAGLRKVAQSDGSGLGGQVGAIFVGEAIGECCHDGPRHALQAAFVKLNELKELTPRDFLVGWLLVCNRLEELALGNPQMHHNAGEMLAHAIHHEYMSLDCLRPLSAKFKPLGRALEVSVYTLRWLSEYYSGHDRLYTMCADSTFELVDACEMDPSDPGRLNRILSVARLSYLAPVLLQK